MIKYICDECKKEIDRVKEVYYEFEISRNAPKAISKRVVFNRPDSREEIDVHEGSWVFYNVVLCEECWKKLGFERFIGKAL